MKKILYVLLLLCNTAMAQTIITTPTVAGTWTIAGSPYIVQNEITVQASDVLTIDPGVVIKFQPTTRLEVFGQLIASGNSGNPITFEAVDTNNWHDELTTTGGWSGLHFHPYGGMNADASILNYCILEDVKYGYSAIMNYIYPLSIERGLKVHNCLVRHNQTRSGMYGAGPGLWSQIYNNGDTLDIDKCVFTQNIAHPSVISVTTYNGYCRITNSHIHHNEQGSGITLLMGDALIENNEIDHNNALYDSAPMYLTAREAIVRGNHVHHNVSPDHGGIACNYGNITLENNFIHNNQQTNFSCGFTEGGGGINLTCFSDSTDDAFFIVRNNIIANNYSAFGGGGINVFQATAAVTNNHLINNSSSNGGHEVFINHPYSQVYMRNNLLFNQIAPGNTNSQDLIHIYSGSRIWFDYNFITAPYMQIVQTSFSYMLMGDTTHNVMMSDPHIIAPTADNNYLTDASTADFHLGSTSPCINEGDTVGAFSSNVDYDNNNRIIGSIDIGAYETDITHMGMENSFPPDDLSLIVYPNPASSQISLAFNFPGATKAQWDIMDPSGKNILSGRLMNMKEGINYLTIPIENLAAGVYFYNLTINGQRHSRTFIVK